MESFRLLEFDAIAYGQIYPDLAGLRQHELESHYSEFGRAEGRCPMPLFDPAFYAANAGIPLEQAEEDYRTRPELKADPHPLFSVEFYRQQVGDVADPVRHYMTSGWSSGFDPHPLFMTRYYCEQWDETSGGDPLSHYIRTGWRAGLKANPLFDPRHYLDQSPDVAAAGTDPLAHYSRRGWREGRSPHLLFDLAYYASQWAADSDPLSHYLRGGHDQGLDPHPLFSTDYYLAQSPDIAGTSVNALAHFLAFGGEELRQHHPLFDPRWYRERTGCVGIPLVHYLSTGGREDPAPEFNSRFYLEHSESARRSKNTPLAHWVVEEAPLGQSFSSLPLDEVVIDLLDTGHVARAAALMRQRHRGLSSTERWVLPFRIGETVGHVDEGWLLGGLPGVLTSDGDLVGCTTVDRPTVKAHENSVVIARPADGIASGALVGQAIEGVTIVEAGLVHDAWTWYLRCLPALCAAVDGDQPTHIAVTAQLDDVTNEMTHFVLGGAKLTTIEPGTAIPVRKVEVRMQEHSRMSRPAIARATGLALILDRNDPITASARASLVSATLNAGGRVVDTAWGAPAVVECVERSDRLIGFAALPMIAFLAAPSATVVALDDDVPEHARREIQARGLTLELIRLPVSTLPSDQHHGPRLDPTVKLEEIVGTPR